MRLKLLILLFIILMAQGCILGQKKLVVNFKNPATFENLKTGIVSVQMEKNQLIIKGSGLSSVKNIRLKGESGEDVFKVESATGTQIIANSVRNISIGVGQVFDLILADAHGSSTYQVAFSLDNKSITAPMLSSMGASSGQILKYNGHDWVPSNLAASQVYMGTWNASSNSPDIITNLSQFQNGDYYIVTTAGTLNSATLSVGDWVMFNGTTWDKIDNSSNVVATFKGRRGAVIPQNDDYTWSQITKTGSRLQDIADIDISARHDGDILVWNATSNKWVSSVNSGGGGSGTPGPGSITTTELANSSVTYAKLNLTDGDIPLAKINGLTAALAGKESSITAGTSAQYYRGDKTWQTLDSSVVTENTNLYFTNARALGVALSGFDDTLAGAVSASDSVLSAFGRTQKQINTLNTNASSYVTKTGSSTVSGTIDARTGFVLVGTPGTANDATPKTYVDTLVASLVAKTGDTMSGDLTLETLAKFKGGSNFVTLKASNSLAGNITLTLPIAVGTSGQVLTSDGTGVMSWATPTATPSGAAGGGLSGTYPNPTIASGLDAAKIADGSISNTIFQYLGGVSSNIQTQLNNKETAHAAGTSAQYYRGDKTWQTLDSSVVTENTNLYFTNARALGVALSGFDDTLAGAVSASDSVLSAFGRTQKQINTLNTNASSYVTKTGSSTVSGTIDARTGFVLVGTPGTANDATPKTYVDTLVASLVAKTGDTMSGTLVLAKTDATTSGSIYGLQITPTYNQVTSSSSNTDLYINRTETSLGSGAQYLIDARANGVTKFNVTNAGITSTSSLRLNGSTSGYVGLAPAANAGSTIYTLPAADGTSGYVLSTNGAGVLSWVAASGGGSSQWTTNGSNIYYSTGSVGIGISSPGYALDVSGSIRATSFLYSSDRRLKKNIVPIEDPVQKIMDLDGVMFKWKKTGEPAMGFIAQEVEKVIPEVVKTDKVSHFKSVQYANIVALIVEAFKEFYQKVEDHFNRVDRSLASLEEENAQLKKRLERQEEQIDQLAQRLEKLEKK